MVFTTIVALAMFWPSTPETSSTLLSCLGRHEVYFEFDYFTAGGHSRQRSYCVIENTVGRYFCKGTLTLGVLVASNFIDFYFLLKILTVMKTSTQSVSRMISPESLKVRQRFVNHEFLNLDQHHGVWISQKKSHATFWKCQKWSILASFWKSAACGQIALPDRSLLIRYKLVENAKISNFKWDILGNFQTLCNN